MTSFAESLKKTGGLNESFKSDLQYTAETLQTISAVAKIDVDKELRYVIEHLPELRVERAQKTRESARQIKDKKERQETLAFADKLEKSAQKLAAPDADEQFKRRAALVELSIRLKAKLRDISAMTPELDPVRLAKFNKALQATVAELPAEVGSNSDRETMARLVFVGHLRDAGGNVDLAVDNFYKEAFADVERGHWADVSIDSNVHGGEGPSVMDKLIERENQRDHEQAMQQNAVLQNLPKLAAEHLPASNYAAYRVMIDNNHLMSWGFDKKGALHFKARELDASDPENTIGKILQRELDYQHIRGANSLIKNTIERLNTLVRENGDREVALSERGAERMRKSTAEIVADPAAKARKPKEKTLDL